MMPTSTIHLQTGRLTLREFVDEDLNGLRELDNDPEVTRFISNGQPRGDERLREFLASCMERYQLGTGFGFWAAIEKPSDEFVGWFHLRPDHEFPEEMEVGYRLKRSCRKGRGLATEGAKALVGKGFREQGVQSVTGRTMKANGASAHVLQKIGLTLVGQYVEDRFPGEDKTGLLFRRAVGS